MKLESLLHLQCQQQLNHRMIMFVTRELERQLENRELSSKEEDLSLRHAAP